MSISIIDNIITMMMIDTVGVELNGRWGANDVGITCGDSGG